MSTAEIESLNGDCTIAAVPMTVMAAAAALRQTMPLLDLSLLIRTDGFIANVSPSSGE